MDGDLRSAKLRPDVDQHLAPVEGFLIVVENTCPYSVRSDEIPVRLTEPKSIDEITRIRFSGSRYHNSR
jgi:hypothetical protein